MLAFMEIRNNLHLLKTCHLMHGFFSSRTRYFTAIYCKTVEINAQVYGIPIDMESFSARNLHNYTVQSGSEYLAQLYCVPGTFQTLSSNLITTL